MAQASNLAQLLAPGAKARNLDLKALLAIASHEGAGGGIGDGGHAFGPFQLNDAGGVLTGKLAGMTPEQKNAWAWSPAGIRYAEDGIARVAAGEHGAQAITDIATRYERPANVQGEISDALAHYGKNAGPQPQGATASVSVGAQAPSPRAPTGNLLGSLIASTNTSLGLGSSPGLASLFQQHPIASPATARPAAPLVPQAGRRGGLATIDGIQVDPAIAGSLRQVISRFGVTPTSGYRSAGHNAAVGGAQHSDHLSGDAVDFGGNPAALAALYKYAQGRFPYTEPWAQTGGSHVHISFKR